MPLVNPARGKVVLPAHRSLFGDRRDHPVKGIIGSLPPHSEPESMIRNRPGPVIVVAVRGKGEAEFLLSRSAPVAGSEEAVRHLPGKVQKVGVILDHTFSLGVDIEVSLGWIHV